MTGGKIFTNGKKHGTLGAGYDSRHPAYFRKFKKVAEQSTRRGELNFQHNHHYGYCDS